MSTGVKIICSWVLALGAGLLLRSLLPELKGILLRGKATHFLGYNRVAFWGCILAGVVATVVLLIKSTAGGRR